jgi:hypothetical protein
VTLDRLLQPTNEPSRSRLAITVAEINRITERVIAVGRRLLDIASNFPIFASWIAEVEFVDSE